MAGARRHKIAKGDETLGVRERILHAAFAILREAGLQQFTQVNVAERAGVRQSHLTYYFPTRQDLLEAVTVEFVAHISRTAGHALGEHGKDAESILARLSAAITDADHMRMFLAVIVEADGDADLRRMMTSATRQITAAVAAELGGANAEERARVALAAVWGLGLYQFLMRPSAKDGLGETYLSVLDAALRKAQRA